MPPPLLVATRLNEPLDTDEAAVEGGTQDLSADVEVDAGEPTADDAVRGEAGPPVEQIVPLRPLSLREELPGAQLRDFALREDDEMSRVVLPLRVGESGPSLGEIIDTGGDEECRLVGAVTLSPLAGETGVSALR